MPPCVIVYGPPGSGKTRHARVLQHRYGCTALVDGWDGVSPLPAEALALTNVEPPFAAAAEAVEVGAALEGFIRELC